MQEGIITQEVAIADNLFTDGKPPRLIGGRDIATGRIVFPLPAGSDNYEPVELPRRGKIWSWTVQRFRPKTPPYAGPEEFAPFALAYVELEGATIVESRLEGISFSDLRIGMEVELDVLPLNTDTQGRTVMTYAFVPVRKGGDDE